MCAFNRLTREKGKWQEIELGGGVTCELGRGVGLLGDRDLTVVMDYTQLRVVVMKFGDSPPHDQLISSTLA